MLLLQIDTTSKTAWREREGERERGREREREKGKEGEREREKRGGSNQINNQLSENLRN
jgi:hypothetical protein